MRISIPLPTRRLCDSHWKSTRIQEVRQAYGLEPEDHFVGTWNLDGSADLGAEPNIRANRSKVRICRACGCGGHRISIVPSVPCLCGNLGRRLTSSQELSFFFLLRVFSNFVDLYSFGSHMTTWYDGDRVRHTVLYLSSLVETTSDLF